jgi:hypothetical protein
LKRVEAEGWTPLDLMLHVMREHAVAGRWEQAADLAKNVAPYVHPKLAAIQYAAEESVRPAEPPIIHVHFVKPEHEDYCARPKEGQLIAGELTVARVSSGLRSEREIVEGK